MNQAEAQELEAGDIGLIVGSDAFDIGDTITNNEKGKALPRIKVDIPTMSMVFTVNSSPLSGREGEAMQSRKLGERLLRECRKNVAFRLRETAKQEEYILLGRGELQFAVLIEQMRREGSEFMVGRPAVVIRTDENGNVEGRGFARSFYR